MISWFIVWIFWNILGLWLAFSVIEAILSWHKNRHNQKKALLRLLRFPLLYLTVYITGFLLFRNGKSSLEDLILGPFIPLLSAYFLIIAGRLIWSILPGENKEVLTWWLDKPDLISPQNRKEAWWTPLTLWPNKNKKREGLEIKEHLDRFQNKVYLEINRPKGEKGGEYQGLHQASES